MREFHGLTLELDARHAKRHGREEAPLHELMFH